MTMLQRSAPICEPTYWERAAETKWGAYITEAERRAVLLSHALSKTQNSAIELGCEGGRWCHLLSGLGWAITCTDVDADALAKCKARLPQANCIHVNPSDNFIPCPAQSADLILCIEVAPVIQSNFLIPECSRVLKNEGLFVGVFFNGCSIRGIIARLKRFFLGGYDYYKFSYSPWKKKLSECGFDVVHEFGFCWFPARRQSNSALVPYFIALERRLNLYRFPAFSPWIVFIAKKRSIFC